MSKHEPVLLNEIIIALQLKPNDNVIDCTLGDGGHAQAMLEKIAPRGQLLGLDADPEAILRAKRYLYSFGQRLTAVRANFNRLTQVINEHKFPPAQAILIDLGWSSTQLTENKRGFSFQRPDEELDMRYDNISPDSANTPTAADIINTYTPEELKRIFHQYGEEKYASEIAQAIAQARQRQPIAKVGELVEIIMSIPAFAHSGSGYGGRGRKKIHPATKIWQALRIEVNRELEALKQALPQALAALAPGGRLAVISFHSLEDRIVKQYFRAIAGQVQIITKKPITPSPVEIKNNPRARSAKLRVILCPSNVA